MLSDANPLTPYRYDKTAICGWSFSGAEVGNTFVALEGVRRISPSLSLCVRSLFCSQFGVSSLGLMCHVIYTSRRFLALTISYIRILTRANGMKINEWTLLQSCFLIQWLEEQLFPYRTFNALNQIKATKDDLKYKSILWQPVFKWLEYWTSSFTFQAFNVLSQYYRWHHVYFFTMETRIYGTVSLSVCLLWLRSTL